MIGDERAVRVGLNEAAFQAMNERLKALADQFELTREPLLLVCECGSADCEERIRVAAADYERLRSDPLLYAVRPGHEIDDVEQVVERAQEYVVVRKRSGTPADVARATDTR